MQASRRGGKEVQALVVLQARDAARCWAGRTWGEGPQVHRLLTHSSNPTVHSGRTWGEGRVAASRACRCSLYTGAGKGMPCS